MPLPSSIIIHEKLCERSRRATAKPGNHPARETPAQAPDMRARAARARQHAAAAWGNALPASPTPPAPNAPNARRHFIIRNYGAEWKNKVCGSFADYLLIICPRARFCARSRISARILAHMLIFCFSAICYGIVAAHCV
jgi:hypothetical protein